MKKIFSLIILAMLTTACIDKNDTPEQVTKKYWQAIKAGDHDTAKKLVSKNSQQNLSEYFLLSKEQTVAIDTVKLGVIEANIATIIQPINSTPDSHHTLDTILVLEDGHWKIDASRSLPPPTNTTDQQLEELAKQLTDTMQENIETMDDAVNEGMQILNETIKEGSKEMGESLLKLMDDLNKSMKDSVDEMKQRRQQSIQQPDPAQGEGMI